MSELDREYCDLLIGSLFHDIGKFWQRAEWENKSLKKQIENEYKWFLGAREIGVKHHLWSAYFLKTVLKEEGAEIRALKHHSPEDEEDFILAIADKLSSQEREEREDEEKVDISKEPLISIFSQIKGIREKVTNVQPIYQPLHGAELSASIFFPTREKQKCFDRKDYKGLWKDFTNALGAIDCEVGFDGKFSRFYHLLEVFTVSIPSAGYYSEADISLFDHSKTTTAIAAALYKCLQNKPTLDLEGIHKAISAKFKKKAHNLTILNQKSFTLLGGDISGIQSFIFDISSEGAAKSLKGRSLYLTLLPEIISKSILKRFSLPYINILFCGGGHFYLLLPSIEEEELEKIQEEVNSILFNAHNGTFSVVIAGIPLDFNAFSSQEFGVKWAEVSERLQLRKKEKFKDIIKGNSKNFFGPLTMPNNLCKVCRSGEILKKNKCGFCISFEDQAESLIKGKILVERAVKPQIRNEYNDIPEVFKALGYEAGFKKKSTDLALNYSINDREFWVSGCDGFVYLPDHTPRDEVGNIVDFDHLSERAEGKKRWGVLRGDVDNLGKIFREGFENRSISRIASLSRNLNLYFTFWLNKLCQDKFSQKTYVIYAGGDDFFIVGSWDVLPELAIMINRDFGKFCQNPHMTLSSAVYMVPSKKYPLYKAAEVCGLELDEAKSGDKDSIAFLGGVFNWQEFMDVSDLKNLIVKMIRDKGVSNALIQYIYSGFTEFEKYENRAYPIHRVWRFIYSLSRLAKRHGVEKQMKDIEETLVKSNYNLEIGGLYATRWAELEI